MYRLLGLEPEGIEPSYALVQSRIHPHDLRPAGEIERLLSRGGSFERKFRILQNGGRVRYVRNRGEILLDCAGKPLKAVGIVVEVPCLHEALSALHALEARYAGLIEVTSAIVWSLNPDGTAEHVPLWTEFTGQSILEASGDGWTEAIHPDDRRGAKDAWDTAVANRLPYERDFRLRRHDGVFRWVRARAVPLDKRDGSLREWVGACVDIHDQKTWAAATQPSTLTGEQLRAARGILNWSVRDLADAAGVSVSTLRRIEETDGPPTDSEESLAPLIGCLASAGIEFLFPPLGNPCVRRR